MHHASYQRVLQLLSSLELAFLLYTAMDGALSGYFGGDWVAPLASVAILALLCSVHAAEGLPHTGDVPATETVRLLLAVIVRTLFALLALLALLPARAAAPIDPAIWTLALSSGAILLIFHCVRETGVEAELWEVHDSGWRLAIRLLLSILAAVFCSLAALASPVTVGPSFIPWFTCGVILAVTLISLHVLFR